MRSIKWGLKNVKFYWKRNGFLLAAFYLISAVLLVIASIQGNIDTAVKEIGQRTGAELIIRRAGKQAISYDDTVYFPIEPTKVLEEWTETKRVDYIALANVKGRGVEEVYSSALELYHNIAEESGREFYDSESAKEAGQITVIGTNDLSETWEFEKWGAVITEGEGISAQNAEQAVAVVSEKFLKWNFIQIGDEITLVNAFDASCMISVKVIGTHSENLDTGVVAGSPMNYIYVPLKQCFALNGNQAVQMMVQIRDPEKSEQIAAEIQNYMEKETGEEFSVQTNNMLYLSAITPLRGIQKVCRMMFCIIYAIQLLITFLIVGQLMIGRKKEIGIWRAIGESKSYILAQLSIEILFPIFWGTIFGSLSALILERQLGDVLMKMLTSFPDITFRISRAAVWQVGAITLMAGGLMVSGLFLTIVHRRVKVLLGEN